MPFSRLRSEPHFARLSSPHGVSFARGTRVEIELDEEQFAGTGAYTFASVLDVFLGLYTSMNSFSQLAVRTRQRKRVLKQWPPRAGQKILIVALDRKCAGRSSRSRTRSTFSRRCGCWAGCNRSGLRWAATAIRRRKWCASGPTPFCISPPAPSMPSTEREDAGPAMDVNFMGLIGPLGVAAQLRDRDGGRPGPGAGPDHAAIS